MDKLLNGLEVSNIIKKDLINEIKSIKKELKLLVYEIGNDPASKIYVSKKKALCEEVGIKFVLKKYDSIKEEDLIKEIEKDNKDKTVTSILVQLPLPKSINTDNVLQKIDYKKDVDGLTIINQGILNRNEKGIVPCTALGIIKLLDYYNIPLEGKNVVVLGRSSLVGLPVSLLLLHRNATVTMCHSKTKDLNKITKNADILISAIGNPKFVTSNMIKKGSVIVDVGINRYNNKICGDVDFDKVIKKASVITPVPKGIGPMTVIMLINNIIECYKLQ